MKLKFLLLPLIAVLGISSGGWLYGAEGVLGRAVFESDEESLLVVALSCLDVPGTESVRAREELVQQVQCVSTEVLERRFTKEVLVRVASQVTSEGISGARSAELLAILAERLPIEALDRFCDSKISSCLLEQALQESHCGEFCAMAIAWLGFRTHQLDLIAKCPKGIALIAWQLVAGESEEAAYLEAVVAYLSAQLATDTALAPDCANALWEIASRLSQDQLVACFPKQVVEELCLHLGERADTATACAQTVQLLALYIPIRDVDCLDTREKYVAWCQRLLTHLTPEHEYAASFARLLTVLLNLSLCYGLPEHCFTVEVIAYLAAQVADDGEFGASCADLLSVLPDAFDNSEIGDYDSYVSLSDYFTPKVVSVLVAQLAVGTRGSCQNCLKVLKPLCKRKILGLAESCPPELVVGLALRVRENHDTAWLHAYFLALLAEHLPGSELAEYFPADVLATLAEAAVGEDHRAINCAYVLAWLAQNYSMKELEHYLTPLMGRFLLAQLRKTEGQAKSNFTRVLVGLAQKVPSERLVDYFPPEELLVDVDGCLEVVNMPLLKALAAVLPAEKLANYFSPKMGELFFEELAREQSPGELSVGDLFATLASRLPLAVLPTFFTPQLVEKLVTEVSSSSNCNKALGWLALRCPEPSLMHSACEGICALIREGSRSSEVWHYINPEIAQFLSTELIKGGLRGDCCASALESLFQHLSVGERANYFTPEIIKRVIARIVEFVPSESADERECTVEQRAALYHQRVAIGQCARIVSELLWHLSEELVIDCFTAEAMACFVAHAKTADSLGRNCSRILACLAKRLPIHLLDSYFSPRVIEELKPSAFAAIAITKNTYNHWDYDNLNRCAVALTWLMLRKPATELLESCVKGLQIIMKDSEERKPFACTNEEFLRYVSPALIAAVVARLCSNDPSQCWCVSILEMFVPMLPKELLGRYVTPNMVASLSASSGYSCLHILGMLASRFIGEELERSFTVESVNFLGTQMERHSSRDYVYNGVLSSLAKNLPEKSLTHYFSKEAMEQHIAQSRIELCAWLAQRLPKEVLSDYFGESALRTLGCSKLGTSAEVFAILAERVSLETLDKLFSRESINTLSEKITNPNRRYESSRRHESSNCNAARALGCLAARLPVDLVRAYYSVEVLERLKSHVAESCIWCASTLRLLRERLLISEADSDVSQMATADSCCGAGAWGRPGVAEHPVLVSRLEPCHEHADETSGRSIPFEIFDGTSTPDLLVPLFEQLEGDDVLAVEVAKKLVNLATWLPEKGRSLLFTPQRLAVLVTRIPLEGELGDHCTNIVNCLLCQAKELFVPTVREQLQLVADAQGLRSDVCQEMLKLLQSSDAFTRYGCLR